MSSGPINKDGTRSAVVVTASTVPLSLTFASFVTTDHKRV